MLRGSRLVGVAAGGLAAALLLAVPDGGAQAPGSRTLTFFEPGGPAQIIDNAPRSPSKDPASRKFRFSLGDELVYTSQLLDKKGGTRVGTLYLHASVVSGRTFASGKVIGHVVLELTDGSQIDAGGVFGVGKDARIAVTGGTGAYAGARGEVASKQNADGSSEDTVTLLP